MNLNHKAHGPRRSIVRTCEESSRVRGDRHRLESQRTGLGVGRDSVHW